STPTTCASPICTASLPTSTPGRWPPGGPTLSTARSTPSIPDCPPTSGRAAASAPKRPTATASSWPARPSPPRRTSWPRRSTPPRWPASTPGRRTATRCGPSRWPSGSTPSTPADGNRNGPPVVASFGLVNERKQTGVLLDALAAVAGRHPDARLAVVGPAGEAELAGLRARADRLGLAGRVEFTGRVEPAEYGRWLQRTTVAVQLRDHTNGETSGAVGACLASGVPTVVTAIGPARELPTGSVAPLPAFARPEEVA